MPEPGLLMSLANRLAAAAASAEGAELMHLLKLSGLIESGAHSRSREAPSDTVDYTQSRRVGIWERVRSDSVFIRSRSLQRDWHLWANIPRIEPKRAPHRIVLIGESVARGYFYDPFHTCALALQWFLDQALSQRATEVIDLARTDLRTEVGELAKTALALQPDAVVVFAGNNWSSFACLASTDLAQLDAVLRGDGVRGLQRLAQVHLDRLARDIVRDICSFYRHRNIPVVWVVPEFNLADWSDGPVNAPCLQGDANRRWIECREAAQAALSMGNLQEAQTALAQMIDLDGGTSASSLRLMAQCCHRLGDLAQARTLLESARDAVIWDLSHPYSPRSFGVVQNAIREEAAASACSIVDLPRCFEDFQQGALPDRRLFVDYSHLTPEGIDVAMALTASRLATAVANKNVAWQGLLASRPAFNAEHRAQSTFLAAIHNAHWSQPGEIVEHHCRQALRTAPQVAELMKAFVELQISSAPALVSAAGERIARLATPATQRYLLQQDVARLDAVLLTSVARALRLANIDVQDRVASGWRVSRSIDAGRTDLLDFYLLSAAGQPQEARCRLPDAVAPKDRPDYYRAYWIESIFPFIATAGSATVEITYRVPQPAMDEAQHITFAVNDQEVATLPVQTGWRTCVVEVPARLVESGVNKIVVRWPMPPSFGADQLDRMARQMAAGLTDALFHVFGEVHSLSACGRSPVAEAE